MDALVSYSNLLLWRARLDSAWLDRQEDWARLSADEAQALTSRGAVERAPAVSRCRARIVATGRP